MNLTGCVVSLILLLLAAAVLVRLLWRRGGMTRERPAVQMQDDSTAEGEERRDLLPSTPPADVVAHEALLSMGWHHVGEIATHGLGGSPVNTYSHPRLPRHRINISSIGEWEHTTTPGMTARGSSVDDLVHHLGAIHGTLSIADLHLPGRRPG